MSGDSRKVKAASKHANYYKVQVGRTEDNKKKKLGKYIRHFPEDLQAQSKKVAEHILGMNYEKLIAGHLTKITKRAQRRAKHRNGLLKDVISRMAAVSANS